MANEHNRNRTYRDLAQSIKTLLVKSGFPSKDSRFTLKAIYDTLLDMRTSYLKRTKVARQGIGQQNVQTIGCIELIEADTNICPCRPPTGCIWLRSKNPIPKTISIFGVTNSNAAFKADYVEWSTFRTKMFSKAKRPTTRYFTYLDTGEGSYLYLYNDDFLENVSMTGLWEDPNHAAYYGDCEESDRDKFLRCNPLDTPLYMDGDIVDIIFKMTWDFLIRSTEPSIQDTTNNSSEDIAGINKTV